MSPDQPTPESLVLSAMAHPLRRRLLDLLSTREAATVSILAAATGQAAGNVSHHLRVLGRARLIEEAPEHARDGREHWWRRRTEPIRWSSVDERRDPAADVVSGAAEAINYERQLSLLRTWWATREDASGEWQNAAFSSDTWLRLHPDELEQVQQEITEVLLRWSRRPENDDPARAPVFVFGRGFPASP